MPWIEHRFDRSSGAGGQNVNKLNTRATLYFDFQSCAAMGDAVKARIAARYASRLARDGRLRIVAQAARTQLDNRRAAEQRLLELLEAVSRTPRPRRATTPTRGSRERRLSEKRRQGATKSLRRSRGDSDG